MPVARAAQLSQLPRPHVIRDQVFATLHIHYVRIIRMETNELDRSAIQSTTNTINIFTRNHMLQTPSTHLIVLEHPYLEVREAAITEWISNNKILEKPLVDTTRAKVQVTKLTIVPVQFPVEEHRLFDNRNPNCTRGVNGIFYPFSRFGTEHLELDERLFLAMTTDKHDPVAG
ncbi:geminivirus rep interacting kinase 1 [Striga asiatica]|uniref:Geminivirus rep interacting kinase 1 n=1 Tax=Striga asiatica TaxID=4170 RepID=A0A5A7PXL1_STRAF|nr:geminivirus rep interacting kinase 1 [Striga asiatica]